jgi:hypothetical protein
MDALDRLVTILGWAWVILAVAYFTAHVLGFLLGQLGAP